MIVKNIQKFIEIEFIKKQTPGQLNDIFRTLNKKLKAAEGERDDLLLAVNTTGKTLDDTQLKLQAAEDHAATMETCAKELEAGLHNEQMLKADLLTGIDMLKAELAKRVPFEVLKGMHVKCIKCPRHIKPSLLCTPESCPLIPKVKTDE
jgi:hypothetical protein